MTLSQASKYIHRLAKKHPDEPFFLVLDLDTDAVHPQTFDVIGQQTLIAEGYPPNRIISVVEFSDGTFIYE